MFKESDLTKVDIEDRPVYTVLPPDDDHWLYRRWRDNERWLNNMSKEYEWRKGEGWYGVDLDGTLAYYDPAKWHETFIGPPIPTMLLRVKKWLSEGKEVRILTARVASINPRRELARAIIETWCIKHLGVRLEVTAEKDYRMIELWDDRCVQVVTNKGEPVVSDFAEKLAHYARGGEVNV